MLAQYIAPAFVILALSASLAWDGASWTGFNIVLVAVFCGIAPTLGTLSHWARACLQ
jgi:ABC-type multidrug transport system permease subunit